MMSPPSAFDILHQAMLDQTCRAATRHLRAACRIPLHMTIPRREDDFQSGPPRRPTGAGESEERTDTDPSSGMKPAWRERFPGWETYEGHPHDPRFESGEDPTHDPRYDTNLNPSAVIPRRLGAVVWIMGITIGILLLVLIGLLFFYHFQQPSPRSPQGGAHAVSTSVTTNRVLSSTNNL